MIIKVWHGIKHDEAEVTEIETGVGLRTWVDGAMDEGGFYKAYTFIPWHRINYVEVPE